MAEGLTRENTEADYYLAVRQDLCVRETGKGQMNVVAEYRKWISGWENKAKGKNYVTI